LVYFKGRKIVSSGRRRPPILIELYITEPSMVGET